MKWSQYLWMGLLSTLLCSGADLVKDGKACSEIVVADNAGSSVLQAAADLQMYLERISGARLPIVTPGKAGAKNLICVGESLCSRKDSAQPLISKIK